MNKPIDDLKFNDGSTFGERKEANKEPHKHRCMRCGEEFDCQSVGVCVAGYDVAPNIVKSGLYVLEHCPIRPDWSWIRDYGKRWLESGKAIPPDKLFKLFVEPSDMNAVDKVRMRAEEGHPIHWDDALFLVRCIMSVVQRLDSSKKLQEMTLQNEIRWMRMHTAADDKIRGLQQELGNAWLIERGGLCLGVNENRFEWVTFTDENAIRFSRRQDAYGLMETLKWEPFKLFDWMQGATATEHHWERG